MGMPPDEARVHELLERYADMVLALHQNLKSRPDAERMWPGGFYPFYAEDAALCIGRAHEKSVVYRVTINLCTDFSKSGGKSAPFMHNRRRTSAACHFSGYRDLDCQTVARFVFVFTKDAGQFLRCRGTVTSRLSVPRARLKFCWRRKGRHVQLCRIPRGLKPNPCVRSIFVHTANRMLSCAEGLELNAAIRLGAGVLLDPALLLTVRGCLAVLINSAAAGDPEMDQSSKNSVALAGDDSAWPEAGMDIAELPEDSTAIPSMGYFLASLVQIRAPALIDYVGQDAYDAWAKRISDEKTVYTENGDGSGTASYDVSVSMRVLKCRLLFKGEFDISQETFADLVPDGRWNR